MRLLATMGIVLSVLPGMPRYAHAFKATSSFHRGWATRTSVRSLHVAQEAVGEQPAARVATRRAVMQVACKLRPAARGFRSRAWARVGGRVWGAPPATQCRAYPGEEDIDWGEPSKEELVYDARLGRDEVPPWAQSMMIRGQPVNMHAYKV